MQKQQNEKFRQVFFYSQRTSEVESKEHIFSLELTTFLKFIECGYCPEEKSKVLSYRI